MPRRKSVGFKRDVGVDPRFKSGLVQKFINIIMERGKKNKARSIVYEAFDILSKKVGGNDSKTFAFFEKALSQIRPLVEVKSRRVGGGVYQVPVEIRFDRASALAFRWLIVSAAGRKDENMAKRIAAELIDASEGRGNAVKKKTEVHRMAEANRAFSHYAW
jgi:small subunit ribosomal protein S7